MQRFTLLATAALAAAIALASSPRVPPKPQEAAQSVSRGLAWLVSVQGNDGGWGQDGGETSYVRQTERLETKGNDVANTAVAVSALIKGGHTATQGQYRDNVRRGVDFILRNVEASPNDGLAVTPVTGTQIQRKLGPFIDTFLTSKLLAELDGAMGDPQYNARVKRSLAKVIRKIEANQQQDGSWNNGGGWAPVIGTSMASQALNVAKAKGNAVAEPVMRRVDSYTQRAASAPAAADAAGVRLYQQAQALEQMSRTEEARARNAPKIAAIKKELDKDEFVNGYGSIGGEEFFSYLNIAEGLKRTGGEQWTKWNGDTTRKIMALQNNDGTWAGHHCITGRVAVTSAAILNLTANWN